MIGQIEAIRRREISLLRKSVMLRLITEVPPKVMCHFHPPPPFAPKGAQRDFAHFGRRPFLRPLHSFRPNRSSVNSRHCFRFPRFVLPIAHSHDDYGRIDLAIGPNGGVQSAAERVFSGGRSGGGGGGAREGPGMCVNEGGGVETQPTE